jgi:ubiquinone/menaquinone biosynthesis C-methylase UbiE
MKANYNRVASFYDHLSRIVFGKAIIEAQKYLVDFIGAGSAILVVGGGTGWILEEISEKHPSGLKIVYVDKSEKMIDLSKKRNVGTNRVVFLNADIDHVMLHDKFDIVFTPFILDNFSTKTLAPVFDKIHRLLLPGSLWLFADFQLTKKGEWWQRPLLNAMYLFFNIFCNVETARLPDSDSVFRKYGYTPVATYAFFGEFISSTVYRNNSSFQPA